MAKNFGGLALLTWGWKESGNGGEAENPLGTLSGAAVILTMELAGIACVWTTIMATLDTKMYVLTIGSLFVKFSCNSVNFISLPPSTKVGWSFAKY